MLSSIHPSFHLLSTGSAAGTADMTSLQKHFPAVPADYRELASEATEIELQHASGQYIRIWGPLGCIEMDEGYGIRTRIPGSLPIGDDGGGHVIFYQDGPQGFGLYHVGYGDLDGDDAIWIAPSLTSFLTTCAGVESF